jgi:hypothetical protein
MKIDRSILVAALGLASVSVASATQYVYITGSTAARDAVYNTFINGQGGFDATPEFVGYGSSTAGNCSWMAFSNTIAGIPTIVKAHWSGSEAGIQDVSVPNSQPFMADPGTGGIPAFSTTPNGQSASNPAAGDQVNGVVDIAQADNSLSYSHLPGSGAAEYPDNLVIPFVFVKNSTTITDQALFTDITADGFYQLANGGDKLSLFTGKAGDSKYVYLTGRDNNSGTRVNVFADTGWGINKLPNQIVLTGATPNAISGGYTTQGQSSGGTLAKSLTDSTTSTDTIKGGTGFIAVAYLGLADDATAEGTPYNAIRLTFNGVAFSAAAVEEGQYDLWGYEYTEVNPADDQTGNAADIVAQALQGNIANAINTTSYEISQSLMHAKRSGPTSHPYHL